MYDAEALFSILSLLVLIIIIVLVIIVVSIILFSNWLNERKFYFAVLYALSESNLNKRVRSIRNAYEVYCNGRYGTGWKTIIQLCQELASKLKNCQEQVFKGRSFHYKNIQNLEDAIEVFRDEYNFEDEKIDKVIKNVSDSTNEDNARTIREYIIRLQGFYQGQVFEINREKAEYQAKMERRKWINRIFTIFGALGTIITIYSFFNK